MHIDSIRAGWYEVLVEPVEAFCRAAEKNGGVINKNYTILACHFNKHFLNRDEDLDVVPTGPSFFS